MSRTGRNTSTGRRFEKSTQLDTVLVEKYNFGKIDDYLEVSNDSGIVRHFIQGAFGKFMIRNHSIKPLRIPDEAILVTNREENKHRLFIIEKKNQTMAGSAETKLWAGPSLKEEYQIHLGDDFEVHYIFVLSDYFKEKFIHNERFQILAKILKKHDIEWLIGNDEDYIDKLTKHIFST